MVDENKDVGTGLGLEQFLAPRPSGNGDKPAEEDKKTEEVKTEENKTEEEKKDDASTHQTQTNKEVDKKTEQTSEKEEVKDDEPGGNKNDPYQKRYFDTRNWANEVHQKNLDHEKKIAELEKKVDDPYGEEKPAEVTAKQKQELAALQGRVEASLEMANSQFGADYIAENIDDPSCEFKRLCKENPTIIARVNNSKTPYLEAVKVLKEEQFFKKYGRDTEKIIEKIEESLEKKIKEKITKDIKEKLEGKEKLPEGIGGVQGSVLESENKDSPKTTPFKNLFGNR